jgi:hypothetical protein
MVELSCVFAAMCRAHGCQYGGEGANAYRLAYWPTRTPRKLQGGLIHRFDRRSRHRATRRAGLRCARLGCCDRANLCMDMWNGANDHAALRVLLRMADSRGPVWVAPEDNHHWWATSSRSAHSMRVSSGSVRNKTERRHFSVDGCAGRQRRRTFKPRPPP